MPDGPHGAGHQVRNAWVAPDGTEFVTGYMYTGVPGPDTGVVWRRGPNEAQFAIAHMTPRHELGTIFGASSRDVYFGGTDVLFHFDGTSWTDLELPPSVAHVSALAVHDDELWLASSSPEKIFHRKLVETKWNAEDAPAHRYNRLAFAGAHVFAGTVSRIAHRFPDGHWAMELENRGAGYDDFYVASPTDVYVAGGLTFGAHVPTLLHTSGDGPWKGIDAPDHVDGYSVFGRSSNEIYVSCKDEVRVFRGKNLFEKTKLRPGRYLAGNADEVIVAYEGK
jgi:hypothetical protein